MVYKRSSLGLFYIIFPTDLHTYIHFICAVVVVDSRAWHVIPELKEDHTSADPMQAAAAASSEYTLLFGRLYIYTYIYILGVS